MQRNPHLVPLSHQHHDALALCVMVERSIAADSSDANLARQAAKAVYFSNTEGENHFALEEEILFPLVTRTLGDHPLLPILLDEHRQLRSLAKRLGLAPARADLEAFTSLLRHHVRKEEREFFEDVQGRLPEAELAQAAVEMRTRAVQICVTDL